jgi:hypothetical protein
MGAWRDLFGPVEPFGDQAVYPFTTPPERVPGAFRVINFIETHLEVQTTEWQRRIILQMDCLRDER